MQAGAKILSTCDAAFAVWQGMSWTRGFSDNGECGIMKLHESLRKIIRQFGTNVLSGKRLLFILSDYRAFEEYPALKQVFEAIVSTGAGKELMRLSLDDDRAGCISYAQNLKKSLSEDRHFREDLAACAVDSILFALGLTDTVTEPSDHGFDAVEHGSGAGSRDAGARTERFAEENRGRKQEERSRRGEGPLPGAEEMPVRKPARPQDTRGGNALSGGAARTAAVQQNRAESPEGTAARRPDPLRNTGSERSSGWLKWIIAAVFLAVVIAAADHSYQNAQTGIEHPGPERSASPAGAGHEQGLRELEQGEKSYYAKNYPEAVKWFRKSAGQGNARAQNWLGEMYSWGLGVSRNNAEAAEWYRKSAEQGNADAEITMGTLYEDGTGVRRDYEEALKWFRRAAAHGSRNAQAGIERVEKLMSSTAGINDTRGSGGAGSSGTAVNAGQAAKPAGQYEFDQGLKYVYGFGVSLNYKKALKWFRKSAEQGNPSGQNWLGVMYDSGYGVRRDYAEAVKWYRKSAEQGNLYGQRDLGRMYELGHGITRDYSEALNWYRKSAAQGTPGIQQDIERVEKLISAGQ